MGLIKKLREETGRSLLTCKCVMNETNWDYNMALKKLKLMGKSLGEF